MHGERRRWVGAEWSGVWGGVSPLQPTRGSGDRRELPSGVRGRALAENGFWRILKATERFFLYLYEKIAGTICISVPYFKFWGLVPRLSVIYAHVSWSWFTSLHISHLTVLISLADYNAKPYGLCGA